MKEELLEIFNHFGIRIQRRKLNEEMLELQDELCKFEIIKANRVNAKPSKDLIGEMGDVYCLFKQFQLYLDITDEQLKEVIETKVNRTKDRIKSRYYE